MTGRDAMTIERLAIDTIRTLSMDAVEKAKSGHPGTPMALAPAMYCLWQQHLRFDPSEPLWPNRDRFVLSAGHASMLLYSTLYLAGVTDTRPDSPRRGEPAVTLEEIQRFRQLGSLTPGHPEHRLTAGVETTTGPLGQGVTNSVGMAIASLWLGIRYNRPDFDLFDYDVFALASDGDLMEGVSSEAASLAGHLQLPNLCWIYDDNRITIEGRTDLAMSESVSARFRAYGWNVLRVQDANDLEQIHCALRAFRQMRERPTLILVPSHIAWGAPKKQDTSAAHGEPLGEEEIRGAKRAYGWPEDAKFRVPDGVREHFAAGIGRRGREMRTAWEELFASYRRSYPEEAAELDELLAGRLPAGWDAGLPSFPADAKGMATREASAKALNAVARAVPWFIGGSADLAPSTKTLIAGEEAGDFSRTNHGARNFHFGIREHAMGGVVNGLALSGLRPFGATFFVFSDYMRPAVRLSAIMEIPSIWVYTHDSIGVGEDGPTHQPVEHLAALRAIPGLVLLRPADANETVEAWRVAVARHDGPTALVLTRQALPVLDRSRYAPASGVARGAYVLADAPGGAPELILMASGSEVAPCIAAFETLSAEGVRARVVSMPSWELFERQEAAYRDAVLPPKVAARVAVEAAIMMGWERWTGPGGRTVGMKGFGASAPYPELVRAFGLGTEAVLAAARDALAAAREGGSRRG